MVKNACIQTYTEPSCLHLPNMPNSPKPPQLLFFQKNQINFSVQESDILSFRYTWVQTKSGPQDTLILLMHMTITLSVKVKKNNINFFEDYSFYLRQRRQQVIHHVSY